MSQEAINNINLAIVSLNLMVQKFSESPAMTMHHQHFQILKDSPQLKKIFTSHVQRVHLHSSLLQSIRGK